MESYLEPSYSLAMWLLSSLALASPGLSPSQPAACTASMGAPLADPALWLAHVRSECASLVREGPCRQALGTPGAPMREACLPVLPPELAELVKKALSAHPSEKIVHMRALEAELLRAKPEQAVVAMLLVAEDTLVVPVDAVTALAPPAHTLSVMVALDKTEVVADGEPVPCSGRCLEPPALRRALAEVGARPGWEAVDSLVIYADEAVPYARVVAVLDAARSRFPNAAFAVESR